MPGFFKPFKDAASGFGKLVADLSDDGRMNKSNLDRMTLISLMKKGAEVPKESDDEKARKDKAVKDGMAAARKNLSGR